MADFQLDDLPTYMIWRSEPLDDSFDLTTRLNVFPPKGSAELDKALQFWFPLSNTAQERRRDAVIAFLNEEKDNSSSEASGPLTSTELENGTQTSTSASTGFHSYDTGPHQSPATDIVYGPIDECVNHHLPPSAPLEGNVEADFMNVVHTIQHDLRIPPAGRSGIPSGVLHLMEIFGYHTSMGTPPSGSTERTDCSTSLDSTNRVTRARFVQNGYQYEHGDCLKTFNRACDLRHHARKHIAPHERPFVCLDCGKRFLWQKDLSRHHAQVHTKLHTKLRKRPQARLPKCLNVCSDCSRRFSRLSDLTRHQRCLHDSLPARVDDDISRLPRDPSHHQVSTDIALHDHPFPDELPCKPLLRGQHMSQALQRRTETGLLRGFDSTFSIHGSIPELPIASRHEPFRIRGLLVVVVSSPGLWMVESVALLLCFVFGVTYPGFVEHFLKVVLLSLCRR